MKMTRPLQAIASAILLALSFSSFNLSFLAWIGLVPLFFAIEGLKQKEAFRISFLSGFLFFLLSMYWLIHVSSFGWIALSFYQAAYFGLFGILISLPFRGRYILFPSAWALLEYLRSSIGGGIGWNLLAYSQYENMPFIQIADITGPYGVSFLIVLVNFALFSILRSLPAGRQASLVPRMTSLSHSERSEEPKPIPETLGVLLIVCLVLIYGFNRIETFSKYNEKSDKRKVAVIQGNIEQKRKWDSAYKDFILDRYKKLTKEASKHDPDLIIWPETSLPGYPNKDKPLLQDTRNFVKRINIPTLIGAPAVAMIDGKDKGDHNSALLFSRRGELVKQYNKLHLVLFGEFIPLERYLPWVRKFMPITGDFISGDDYTIFQTQAKYGVLICFEDIFPHLTREFVKRGSDFMVNITNDAWFMKTAAAYQHAANSIFRAVENRRVFVRAANTGLSCFIDNTGRIIKSVKKNEEELFVEGYEVCEVPIAGSPPFSFYTRFGDIFIIFCLSVFCFFIIDYIRLRRYNI